MCMYKTFVDSFMCTGRYLGLPHCLIPTGHSLAILDITPPLHCALVVTLHILQVLAGNRDYFYIICTIWVQASDHY